MSCDRNRSSRGLEAAERCRFRLLRAALRASLPSLNAAPTRSFRIRVNSIPPVKGGKPKLDYLDRAGAGERPREYLGVAKSASDCAGRLLALVVMARYAKEEALAQSNRSSSPASTRRCSPFSRVSHRTTVTSSSSIVVHAWVGPLPVNSRRI